MTGWAIEQMEPPGTRPIKNSRLKLLEINPECWVCKKKLNRENSCTKRKSENNERVLICTDCCLKPGYLRTLGLKNSKGGGPKKRGSSKKRRYRKWVLDSHCIYCGMDISFLESTEDHVVPLSRGGGRGVDNIVLACKPCNTNKASLSREQFENSKWLTERIKQVKG